MISRADIFAARAPLSGFATMGMAWGGFAAQVPVIKAQIGAGDGAFGSAMFVAALGAIAAMWLAPLADKIFGRRTLVLLASGLAMAYLLPGLMTSVVSFALAMLLISSISGTQDVIMNARIADVEAARGAPIMNFAHATFSFAYAFAALLAGIGREMGLPPVLVFTGIGALALALCLWIAQDPGGRIEEESEAAPPRIAQPLLWLVGGVLLIGFMAEQGTEGWSALHLERNLGAGAVEGAFGPAILGLTMGIGRMGGQALVRRFSELVVIATASSIAALGAFTAAATGQLAIAYIGFAALGFGISVIVPMAYAHIGRRVSSAKRTWAIARVSVIGYSGFFIGPPLMGFLAEGFGLAASFSAVGVTLALIALVGVPGLASLERRARNAD